MAGQQASQAAQMNLNLEIKDEVELTLPCNFRVSDSLSQTDSPHKVTVPSWDLSSYPLKPQGATRSMHHNLTANDPRDGQSDSSNN